MERTEFEKIIKKSSTKQIIIATCILAFGLFMGWMAISGVGMEDVGAAGKVVIWILVVLCVGIGGLINYKAFKAVSQVNSGSHPVLKAIDTNDRGFVVWTYENITQVKGGGSDHYVYIFTNDGKQINLSVKKKRVSGILEFIGKEFPQAIIGWSEEQEKKFKEIQKALKKG